MNNLQNFTAKDEQDLYPVIVKYFDISSLLTNAKATYDIRNRSNDPDFDGDDDEELEIIIPNVQTLYQLIEDLSSVIKDLSQSIHSGIQSEKLPLNTFRRIQQDVYYATQFIAELSLYDSQL